MKEEGVDFVRIDLVRDDLQDRPLAWQVAVRPLVKELTASSVP